jgi:hypothetical protein
VALTSIRPTSTWTAAQAWRYLAGYPEIDAYAHEVLDEGVEIEAPAVRARSWRPRFLFRTVFVTLTWATVEARWAVRRDWRGRPVEVMLLGEDRPPTRRTGRGRRRR